MSEDRDDTATLEALREALRAFAAERDWEQFHAPKNLAMALAVEAAELMEPLQWLSEEQSARPPPEVLAALDEEIADVLIYLVRLADRLGIDPLDAAWRKLAKNARRYPPDAVRGSARKRGDSS